MMHIFTLVAIVLVQAALAAGQPVGEPLVGTVVDSEGRPVAGVEVLLSNGWPPQVDQPAIGGYSGLRRSPANLAGRHPVMARALSDKAGEFRIDVPAEMLRSQEPSPVALWAYRDGSRVAWQRLPWATPAPQEPIRLVLEEASPAAIRVLNHDDSPAGAVRVSVTAIDRLAMPDALAKQCAVATAPDGSARIAAFMARDIRAIRIDSPTCGVQTIHGFGEQADFPKSLRLEPIGGVAGRVVTDSDQPVTGLRVEARTMPGGFDLGGTTGWAEAVTDAAGRFQIPAIAAGRLELMLDFRSLPDLPYRGLAPASQAVESGRTTMVQIRLKRAVRIEGMIRERATGAPIKGATPVIPDQAVLRGGNPNVMSDGTGKFHGYMEGDQPYAFIYATPKPYFVPPDAPDDFHLLSPGATEFKLRPIELARGQSLRGMVVDETGKPVMGALVRGSWGGKETIIQLVASRTGPSGEFVLEGLDPLADLRLTAEAHGRATAAPQTARAKNDQPVKLVLSPSNTVVLSGRVVDTSGKPVPAAEIFLRSQTRNPEGQVWRIDPVVWSDRDTITTGPDGRFQTPFGVPKDREFEARVRIARMTRGRTAWLKPGEAAAGFGDVVLRRIRAVEGFVHNRQGKPIAGAAVFQSGDGPIRTRTLTDSNGRFRLPGLIEGTVILFASKDGFRLHGQPIDTEAASAELVLTRSDETPPPRGTRAGGLPHDAELALARRLLNPYIEKVVAQGTDTQKYQALAALAPVDPARTLELLDAHGAGKPQWSLDWVRREVAIALSGANLDEALSIVETIQAPDARTDCLIKVADKLSDTDRARQADLLAEAQLHARAVKEPAQKVLLLGLIAERWLDRGEKERGLALIAEARKETRDVPPPGYQIAVFAEALARVDYPAALEMNASARATSRRADRVDRVFVFDRSYGEIAYRLARQDPGSAAHALSLITSPQRRGGYVAAACMRMAANDLPRARRLAESIDDPLVQAYALGAMARGLATTDKVSAKKLLDLALGRLEQRRDDAGSSAQAANIAAILLDVVELVAPDRLEESVWRAAALRPTLVDEPEQSSNGRADAELAMILARYHQAAAAAVLARAVEDFASSDADSLRPAFVAMAIALIDPNRAATLVESLPDDPGLDRLLPKNAARIFTAELLGKTGQDRCQTVRQWGFSLWTPQGFNL
jgi:hypothetical protein